MSGLGDSNGELLAKAVTEFQALQVTAKQAAEAAIALIDRQHELQAQLHETHLALHALWVAAGKPQQEGS